MAKKKSMYQRSDGLYEKKVTINGKRVVFRGKTEREIFQKIAAHQEKAERGLTFEDMANEWWEDKEPRLSPNSVGGYNAALRRAIERFGDAPLQEINATQIRSWLNHLGKQGFARKTVSNHLIVITGIFSWACENRNYKENPSTLVHVPDGLTKKRRKMPTSEEIFAIQAAKNNPDGLFFYFLLYTGLRRGEALALQWKDIDADQNVIRVTRSLYYAGHNKGSFKAPKSDAGEREVIYLDRLKGALEPHRSTPESFVFGGDSPLTYKALQCLLKRYCKQTGLNVTPHQLRHAFATLCFEANIPEKTAQGLLGHAQLSTTMDIYAELRDRKRMEAAAALNGTDF
jgi:integrase